MTVDNLIDAIRGALDPTATPEARATGAGACRAILAALEPPQAQPLAASPQIANIVSALRGVPPDQLLDLAIAKLRAALPAGVDVARPAPLNFNIVPIPRRGSP